jgi:hypothetical protein
VLRIAPRIELIFLFLEIGRVRLLAQLFKDLDGTHGQHTALCFVIVSLASSSPVEAIGTASKIDILSLAQAWCGSWHLRVASPIAKPSDGTCHVRLVSRV